MDLNNIIRVHIYQLPEKTNSVDKDNEYTIIHDGVLKKIKVNKLYEYFNQDYKIDNIVRYFEEMMYSIDKEYEPQYLALEVSLTDYEKLVGELVEKFNINKDNIRKLETLSGELDKQTQNIDNDFKSSNEKCLVLFETLSNFSIIVYNMKRPVSVNSNDINNLNTLTNILVNNTNQYETTLENLSDKITDIKDHIDSDVDNKKEFLLNSINDEYDKILAILDYYHHIHEEDFH